MDGRLGELLGDCSVEGLGGEAAEDPSEPIGESNGERTDSDEVSGEDIDITEVQPRSLLVEKFGSSQDCFRPLLEPWRRPYGPRDPTALGPP